MHKKLCVTSGTAYTDIDVLACAIAFAELNDCDVVLQGAFNATISKSIRKWNLNFRTQFDTYDQFVIVDMSNPKYVPEQISESKIAKVFDHHTGFENYWGNRGQIELVGACATLIFELFGNRKPSITTANLLYTAIFANTLNFKASVTTERDKKAFEELKPFIDLPANWIEQYYSEIESDIFKNFEEAIQNDTKILENNWAVAQIELYDAKTLLQKSEFLKTLKKVMSKYSDWLLTMPSISEGKNYLFSNSENIKQILSEKMQTNWNNEVGETKKLYLRKEILKVTGIK